MADGIHNKKEGTEEKASSSSASSFVHLRTARARANRHPRTETANAPLTAEKPLAEREKKTWLTTLLFGTQTQACREEKSTRFSRLRHFFSFAPLTKTMRRALHACAYFSSRTVCVFLLALGASLFILYFSGHRFLYDAHAPFSQFVCAIATTVIGLPLFFSRRPLAIVLSDYSAFEVFFFDFLLLQRPRSMNRANEHTTAFWRLLLAFLLGVGCAFLTGLVSSVAIVGILFLLVFAGCVFASPECCLVIVSLALPFLSLTPAPTFLLAIPLSLLLVSFFRKVLCKKRIFRFSLPDFLILLLALFYALSGFFTYRANHMSLAALSEAAVSVLLILSYFPAANLLTNRRTVHNVVGALLFSGAITCILGLLQQLTGRAQANWLDLDMLRFIDGRVSSVFADGPNVFAAYLTLLLPFCFFALASSKRVVSGVASFLLNALFIAALVFTWSRGAWLGCLFAAFAFIFLLLRHRPTLILGVGAVIPYILICMPPSVYHRFASIGNLYDSSISYRLSTWRSSWNLFKDHLLTGVGIGTEAFHGAYLPYAAAGTESVAHAHNLYLEMGIELGILPLLIFLVFIGVLVTVSLSRTVYREGESMRTLQIACFASLVGILIQGCTDYIFYNYRIMFLFFLIAGMLVASARKRLTEAAVPEREVADASASAIDISVK